LTWLYGILAVGGTTSWLLITHSTWLSRLGYEDDGQGAIGLGLLVFALSIVSGPIALFPQSVFSRQRSGLVRCVALMLLLVMAAYCCWVIWALWALSQSTDL